MAENKTTKRNLNLPGYEESADVMDLNENFENLDNAVPDTRKVNGHGLNQDISLTKDDLGSTLFYYAGEVSTLTPPIGTNTAGMVVLLTTTNVLYLWDGEAYQQFGGDTSVLVQQIQQKLDKNQGAANIGKLLSVGEGGLVTLTDEYMKKNVGAANAGKTMVVDNNGDVVPGSAEIVIDSVLDANSTNPVQNKVIKTALENIDVPGYNVEYGTVENEDGEEVENVFQFIRENTDGTEEVIKSFQIQGGNGGGGNASSITITRVTQSPVIAVSSGTVVIQYNYASIDTAGDNVGGTYSWKLGSRTIATGTLINGLNTFDATEFVDIGTQKLTLTCVDENGSMATKTWTVQIVDIYIESSFNDTITYEVGHAVSVGYTPYGSIEKTVHILLDGEEIETRTTALSGSLLSYTIPAQERGAHLVEMYITATIGSTDIESEHIYKDIIWYDEETSDPIIGCIYRYDYYGTVNAKQYDNFLIPYYVFDPNTNMPVVTYTLDGEDVSTQTLEGKRGEWNFRSSDIGTHVLVITCRTVSVTIRVLISTIGIDVSPVTANLAFDFDPTGITNSSNNRLWVDANNPSVGLSVNADFDWANGGYKIDSEGNTYFCVKSGDRATFTYDLFRRNAGITGAEFKMIFKVTNVAEVTGQFLNCFANNVGLKMNVHDATLSTSAGDLFIPYCEEDRVEFEYCIDPIDTEDESAEAIIMSYEDGLMLRPMIYDNNHRLYQTTPVPITVGSDDCDVWIYRMKAYESNLSNTDVLKNFIADALGSDEILSRYYRNQIYDENGNMNPETLAEACPQLRIIMIDCPHFTNDKKDYVKGTNVQCIYKNGDPVLDNWNYRNGYHAGQGTTSNEYGFAGRNIDLIMCADGVNQIISKIPLDPEYITELELGDGTVLTGNDALITFTRTSVPTNWINIKVNIASSENANNALMQKHFNDYLPYQSVANQNNPFVKNSMEFVNCAIFLKETDPDITTHREFQDTNWHFYGIGNFGDSKKTDASRVNDVLDTKEFCVEILDNTLENATFQTGVYYADDGIQHTFEPLDGQGFARTMVYPITTQEWNNAANRKRASLYADVFDGEGSYEFRYDMGGETKDGMASTGVTSEAIEAQRNRNKQIWREMYEFVVTANDSEFVSKFDGWFIKDAMLYWYLFTERYTMIDNRAKNSFWHFADIGTYHIVPNPKELFMDMYYELIDDEYVPTEDEEPDSSKTYYWRYAFDLWDYDNDTSLGIDNNGELKMTYGKEDVDYKTDGVASSGYIFNGAESTIWRRIRANMHNDLRRVYQICDSAGCWNAELLINEFDAWQRQFPEELVRLDVERKYLRTYRAGTARFLRDMMNGFKRYQRRQFERDQEIYMGTKYLSTSITSNQIMFRCNTPTGGVTVAPDYSLTIVPYSDMYISVLYGNAASAYQIRAKAGQTYTIPSQLDNADDTAILIYAASRIQALNDLSACYIRANDFSKAVKLKSLVIGSDEEGYENNFITTLNIGNNTLLELLDIRNCPILTGSLNLSPCGNLTELYAENTAITAVTFASNGRLETAHLPESITALTINYLNDIIDWQATYDNLSSLTKYGGVLDELEIVEDAVDTLATLRLGGIDWTFQTGEFLNSILDNVFESVLSGAVEITGIIRSREIEAYRTNWPDLTLTYNENNVLTQYKVTFVNADGTVLAERWVDQGDTIADPVGIELDEEPSMESTAQYNFVFDGWDKVGNVVVANTTVTAQYEQIVRTYTVEWRLTQNGEILKRVENAAYGSELVYDGDIPRYTEYESSNIFYLFTGWDRSTGFITGDMMGSTAVMPIWERCTELPSRDKDINEMTLAEIYALKRYCEINHTSIEKDSGGWLTEKDWFEYRFGYDMKFMQPEESSNKNGTVESIELVNEDEPLELDGMTAIDTGIKLFGENERSFVLAIDCAFGNTVNNSCIVSCDELNGNKGFRLEYNAGPRVQWGNSNTESYIGNTTYRDMFVIRHIKGSNQLQVYCSGRREYAAFWSNSMSINTLVRNNQATSESPLILGAVRYASNTEDDYYSVGRIWWAKIWFGEIGETDARKVAIFPHIKMRFQYIGADKRNVTPRQRYYRTDNNERCVGSFIAAAAMPERSMSIHLNQTTLLPPAQLSNINEDYGVKPTYFYNYLNGHFADCVGYAMQQLSVEVNLPSFKGGADATNGTELVPWTYYLHSIKEYAITNTINAVFDDEGSPITFFNSNNSRITFKGIWPLETSNIYQQNNDPSQDALLDLHFGDIWNNNSSEVRYIYVPNDKMKYTEFMTLYQCTIIDSFNGLGKWISAAYIGTRSRQIRTTYWYAVNSTGAMSSIVGHVYNSAYFGLRIGFSI